MKRLAVLLLIPWLLRSAEPITLRWLDGSAPAADAGVTWGVPWPKGALKPGDPLQLEVGGRSIPIDTRPLAYWPDGSVKWTGHAIAAHPGAANALTLSHGVPAKPAHPLSVVEAEGSIEVRNGMFTARIGKRGRDLVQEITGPTGDVMRHGRLVASREEQIPSGPDTVRREVAFESEIEDATVESSGPVQAVIKITGRHAAGQNGRRWLPFTVRMSFFADSATIRLVHSFVFDGDPARDFICGLGVRFSVPFREELHNRHMRLGMDADGVWAQPVRMLPGFRPQVGRQVVDLYRDHLDGRRVPSATELEPRTREALQTMPIWGDAKLTQLAANGWILSKRTTADASWLKVTEGKRANGFAWIGDVSGGVAVSARHFWQRAPASLEITGAGRDAAECTVWLWSPDATPMDLRRYDEIPHGLAVNYEDWKPGWGTAHGIAATHELTLWIQDTVPANDVLNALAATGAEPPHLVCRPEYYHAQRVFGYWALPNSTNATTRWLDGEIHGLVDYYQRQVDERAWYGFWDFGDIMHNYDVVRQEWRYDIGGWAWANTELMPDLLLWYSFLRTGRADWYRFAEAMTRHTSEVDVHHVGPFAPLGSRHNVNHWGDGAKQPRISHAGLKRFLYFLSGGDGRLGDLLREQLDADLTYAVLQPFNNSHYVPNPDGSPRLDARTSPVATDMTVVLPAPRPEQLGPRPSPSDRTVNSRFGLEWMCYAMNWTTEWERGGDPRWRARVEADIRAMTATLDSQGRLPGRYFDMIFGGPETMWEIEPMYDAPEFWQAWVNTCEAIGRTVEGNHMTGPRLLAYAAFRKRDPALGRLAWEKLIGPPGRLPPAAVPQPVSTPEKRPLTAPAFLGAPVGWQQHGVASVQWALNALQTMELAKDFLPEWEKGQ